MILRKQVFRLSAVSSKLVIPGWVGIPDIHHHREADDLGRTVEIAEGIFHPQTLRTALAQRKPICSDNAAQTDLPIKFSASSIFCIFPQTRKDTGRFAQHA